MKKIEEGALSCSDLRSVTFLSNSGIPFCSDNSFVAASKLITAIVTEHSYRNIGASSLKAGLKTKITSLENVFYLMDVPDTMTSIQYNFISLSARSDLGCLRFESTTGLPETIASNAFSGCPNLTDVIMKRALYKILGNDDATIIAKLKEKLGINTITSVEVRG